MEDGQIFLITSSPLPLINTCRKNLILAGSISLDSTFNKICKHLFHVWSIYTTAERKKRVMVQPVLLGRCHPPPPPPPAQLQNVPASQYLNRELAAVEPPPPHPIYLQLKRCFLFFQIRGAVATPLRGRTMPESITAFPDPSAGGGGGGVF
jgi:hypothetical protein